MEEIKLFNIQATVASLRGASKGDMDERLREPLRTIATGVVSRALNSPLAIYLGSDDSHRDARNYFGFALARLLRERLANTIVVDSDFLSVGLSGMVPDPEGLGLLDLILYGSSVAVISQRAEEGTTVIGAGSFTVSKRAPFVMDAFDDSVRYLVGHAGCVIFCGPALDEDDNPHPMSRHVDLPIVVGSAGSDAKALNAAEQKFVAEIDAQVWGVRFAEPVVTPVTLSDADDEGIIELRRPPGVDDILDDERSKSEAAAINVDATDAEITRVIDVPFDEEGPDEVIGGRRWNSAFPKIITSGLGVLLVGFLLWWLYLTKSIRDGVDEPIAVAETSTQNTGETPADDLAATGSDATVDAQALNDSLVASAQQPIESAGQGAETDASTTPEQQPTKRASPVEPGALSDYAGKYLVHISSFRGIDRARDDAGYLTGRGYDIVMALVDLGSKGSWYRIYVGPFDTEREAANAKIRLDENPRVRSTRITKVPR